MYNFATRSLKFSSLIPGFYCAFQQPEAALESFQVNIEHRTHVTFRMNDCDEKIHTNGEAAGRCESPASAQSNNEWNQNTLPYTECPIRRKACS